MTTIEDFEQVIETYLRDVLRGVDSDGNDNGYTTTINHPDDYDLTTSPITIKAVGEWIDKRQYIKTGTALKDQAYNGVSLNVMYVDCDEHKLAAQGLQCFEVEGALFTIAVDLTQYPDYQWRHYFAKKIAGQVRETLQTNISSLYQDVEFQNIGVRVFDASSEDTMVYHVQFSADVNINAS